MKRYAFLLAAWAFLASPCLSQGKVGYAYDAAGNRVSRTLVLSNAKKNNMNAARRDFNGLYTDRVSFAIRLNRI